MLDSIDPNYLAAVSNLAGFGFYKSKTESHDLTKQYYEVNAALRKHLVHFRDRWVRIYCCFSGRGGGVGFAPSYQGILKFWAQTSHKRPELLHVD